VGFARVNSFELGFKTIIITICIITLTWVNPTRAQASTSDSGFDLDQPWSLVLKIQ